MRPAEFQVYGVSFIGLAPAAVGNAILTFDASSDFIWYYAAFTALNHAANTGWTSATEYVPPIRVLMTPGDTSTQMMNIAVPLTHFFGTGRLPFFLPAPRKLPARTTMVFQVTNDDTTITYDLWLSLIGVRQFLVQQAATS